MRVTCWRINIFYVYKNKTKQMNNGTFPGLVPVFNWQDSKRKREPGCCVLPTRPFSSRSSTRVHPRTYYITKRYAEANADRRRTTAIVDNNVCNASAMA
jgi:hypothetical protein